MDIFDTQQPEKVKVKYDHIVLFDKSSTSSPFGVFPTSMFSGTEIKERWIISVLDSYSRLKDLHLSDNVFSLFAKLETGTIFHSNQKSTFLK